ncbi:hypothetical protein NEPAR06_2317 [Nematocida parisii]|uniref:Uncharacterized protein n=3 Tax=Nematocida parisii TaxID=586133 RepID=I3EFB8_NEMP3|nr:hypothetical protein NEQG_01987 [Nematocida parisii ERTm3]KAI5130985.1 hypothetical protein NEPAR08_2291 [Nematocida parisii]KAI5131155.1 hypothetical protein NEPAR03_2314 [Nematocida parisii]KAI5141526.1 hypothetical protein NEPAR04_1027 [Nematocida parisii]KAI5146323.1 hypothetical protein NEPAR07_2291 [Nematocida parisii]
MSTTDDHARALLTESLMFLPHAPIEAVYGVMARIVQLSSQILHIELPPSEFISLITLLNQRPSHFLVISIFRVLSVIHLNNEQIVALLACHHKQMPADSVYSTTFNWSFLETPIAVKSNFIRFIGNTVLYKRLPRSEDSDAKVNNYTSFDVVQVLFFLFDDENKSIRLKSYKYACAIVRRERSSWSVEEKKKYRALMSQFGKECLRVLKNEHKLKKLNKQRVDITTCTVQSVIKIKIRLGQNIRKKQPRLQIFSVANKHIVKKAGLIKDLKLLRKNTIIYVKKEEKVALQLMNGNEKIKELKVV